MAAGYSIMIRRELDDDESGFLFGHHVFVPGEYVSVSDTAGTLHTFVVKAVTPLGS